jgi:hypothetical protein
MPLTMPKGPPMDIGLKALEAQLSENFVGSQPPRYHRLIWAAVNRYIPARKVGGRWRVEVTDVPDIARHFGLRPKTADAA